MADINDVSNLESVLDAVKQKIQEVKDKLVNELANGASESAPKVAELRNELNQLDTKSNTLSSSLSFLKNKMFEVAAGTGAASEMTKQASSTLSEMGNVLKNTAGLAVSFGSAHTKSVIDPMKNTRDVVDGALGNIAKGYQNLTGAQDILIKSQSQLRDALVMGGVSMGVADRHAGEYISNLNKLSVATGLSTGSLQLINKEAGLQPEFLLKSSEAAKAVGLSSHAMITPLSVAAVSLRAFGLEGGQAGKAIQDAFLNFNETPLTTAKNLGIMKQAANDAGVRIDVARDQIIKASSPLAIFGKNTAEAAGMWNDFTKVLKEGGVPINQIGEMVSGLTKSLAGMTMENRAFIGMVSGATSGASALGGALKLEFAMRSPEGMEKNLQALTGTLAKFAGGKIITLEQAAANPQLEQQFTLQRQLLAKLTGNNDPNQQARILEVLQQVQSGGMSQVQGGNALKEVFSAGKSLQEKTMTVQERTERVLRANILPTLERQLIVLNENLKITTGINALEEGTAEGKQLELKPALEEFIKGVGSAVKVTAQGKEIDKYQAMFEKITTASTSRMFGQEFAAKSREAEQMPKTFLLKATAPEKIMPAIKPTIGATPKATISPNITIPGLNNIAPLINTGNTQSHSDLSQLISATRDGFTNLNVPAELLVTKNKELSAGAMPTAPIMTVSPTESTIHIKISGEEGKFKNNLMKYLPEMLNKIITDTH